MAEPTREDLLATNRDLRRMLRQRKAQLRQRTEDLDWAEEQIRVLRRLVVKLARENPNV